MLHRRRKREKDMRMSIMKKKRTDQMIGIGIVVTANEKITKLSLMDLN